VDPQCWAQVGWDLALIDVMKMDVVVLAVIVVTNWRKRKSLGQQMLDESMERASEGKFHLQRRKYHQCP